MIESVATQVTEGWTYVPAVFGLGGVIIGGAITSIAQYMLMSRRIEADERLTLRKYELDIQAGQRRRKQELAEEAISAFHEFRDIMRHIRSPMSRGNEGKSRQRDPGESEEVSRSKDTYFVILERADAQREKISAFFSREYRMIAWFGNAAAAPYLKCNEVLSGTTAAASMLVRMAHNPPNDGGQLIRDLQAKIWWTDLANDSMAVKLGVAIGEIETICRPILSEQP